ncbi:ATP-binding protein [Massilia sp. TSP1-1-2]|uniref:ATP-binding protein n=1 Tax=Massilia sp. TSP1-1-2 TaxID=2804649 RepID=UPI003CED13C0
MPHSILTVAVKAELEVVAARQRARQIASLAGLLPRDQARISTAVSELARNIINDSGAGSVAFAVEDALLPQLLVVSIKEPGARRRSEDDTAGVRRLIDQYDISTDAEGGTTIVLQVPLPQDGALLTPAVIEAFSRQLAQLPGHVVLSGVQDQNKELTSTVEALQEKQEELVLLTETLETSNSTVLALNASLDEKAATLELADLRKDEFLAILSHELRGPLSAVGMAAQMLETPSVPPERQAQLAQLISRQVTHMTRMVEDLLDVSRISRGTVLLKKSPVDMREVVQYAIEQHTAGAAAKHHTLDVALPDHACMVSGEAVRLVQVTGNLLANAIRYTPDGGAITVALTRSAGMVELSITDNGIGITKELIPRLFDLYVQAEQSTQRGSSGLGLGLALVKSLLEAHGGSVSAASDGMGHGGTFLVRVPHSAA